MRLISVIKYQTKDSMIANIGHYPNLLFLFGLIFLSCNSVSGEHEQKTRHSIEEKTIANEVVLTSNELADFNESEKFAKPIEFEKKWATETDKAIINLPKSLDKKLYRDPAGSLPILIKYLQEEAGGDQVHLVKLFHDWITYNIAYDAKAFFSGKYPSQDYTTVLKTRKSVCSGNANLFQKMCELARIECETVGGYSRGYGFEVFDNEELSAQVKHVWNAVKLKNGWHLLDVTWDAGYIKGKKFVKEYSTAYLFPDPSKMIHTHFPKNKRWQLLKKPLTVEEFRDLPEIHKGYFSYNIQLSEKLKKINTVQDKIQFDVKAAEGVYLSAQLFDSNNRLYDKQVFLQKTNDLWEVSASFPKKGEWVMQLYAGTVIGEKYEGVKNVGFISRSSSKDNFPQKYLQFEKSDCFIESPINGPLIVGKTHKFRVKIVGAIKAALVANDKWYHMKKTNEKDVFELDFEIPRTNKLKLLSKERESEKVYDLLLEWDVK